MFSFLVEINKLIMASLFSLMVLLLLEETVSKTVEDPCPSDITERGIVADMCKSSNSLENRNLFGNINIDSVVLRVQTWQDQCICQLSLIDQLMTERIVLNKYDGRTSTVPEERPCGLVLDIEVIDNIASTNFTKTLNCDFKSNTDATLGIGQNLRFTSRITEGQFSRGYCIQIYRAHFTTTPYLKMDCELKNTTDNKSVESTSLPTTKNTIESSTYNTSESISNRVFYADADQGVSHITYIAVGAGCGVLLIIIIITVIIVIRRSCSSKASTQNSNHFNKTTANDCNTDQDYDGLKDNVLYVPGGDIFFSRGEL